jgi:hypothetical protein
MASVCEERLDMTSQNQTPEIKSDDDILAAMFASMKDISKTVPKLRATLYGDLGTGKTVLAMQLAKAISRGTILYIDFSQGFATLTNEQWAPLVKGNVKRIQYDKLSQLDLISKGLQDRLPGWNTIDVIIIDELSSIQEAVLTNVMKMRRDKDKTLNPLKADWDDYGAVVNLVNPSIRRLLKSDVHVIVVCHDKAEKDDRNIVRVTPNLQNKVRMATLKDMHLVGRVWAEEVTKEDGSTDYIRGVQCNPTTRVDAKNRIQGVQTQMSFPKLVTIVSKFVEGKVVEVEETTADHSEESPVAATILIDPDYEEIEVI